MTVRGKFKVLLKYILRFGPIHGPLILLRIGFNTEFARIYVPGYQAPMFLRPNTSDAPTFEKIFMDSEYDLSFLNLNPKLIIDGGSNVGYATIFFAKRYPNARIISVEPEGSNFRLLVQNTQPYPNVTRIKAALWNRKAFLKIENLRDEKYAFRVTETVQMNSHTIRSITMMDLLSIFRIKHVDILKLDIEGAEKELFESNYKAWLDRVDVIVIELHDRLREGCSASFYQATSQYRYKHFRKGEHVILVGINKNFARP